MADETGSTVHCEFEQPCNLLAVLDDLGIEYLDVDAERTIAIYQSAILMLAVSDGDFEAVSSLDIELREPPVHETIAGPGELLDTFLEEVTTTSAITR
ncbi:hypothetical protein LPA44_16945 [Halobacterium sp. KA-4]|uniref:hypothetical protein n=1 Tax=Halobacterium sp. KA-4 TaxID=2896367 RepID=UPI001E3CBC24|nr:hypothetical protein [Halobacterium sp. KA-4]MCD2201554.1 hypothetical protein [Halobacterium sp. KA-4]